MLPPFLGGPIKAPSVDASYLWMYSETARSLYWSMEDKEVRATSTSRPGCQRFHLSNLTHWNCLHDRNGRRISAAPRPRVYQISGTRLS